MGKHDGGAQIQAKCANVRDDEAFMPAFLAVGDM